MSNIATLDQQRAKHAWAVIEKVTKLNDADKKQFGTQAKKLPTRIMAAGLGQALAFLAAKGHAQELQTALADWLSIRREVKNGDNKSLLYRLINGDADFQRYATAECLAYLVWLVRFADAADLTTGKEE